MNLPHELQRAQTLSNKLQRAAGIARHHRHDRVTISLEAAEELIQLLEDSLRTAKQFSGLREFDGSVPPPPPPRRLAGKTLVAK